MNEERAAYFLLIGSQYDKESLKLILIFTEVQLYNWFFQSQSDGENDYF